VEHSHLVFIPASYSEIVGLNLYDGSRFPISDKVAMNLLYSATDGGTIALSSSHISLRRLSLNSCLLLLGDVSCSEPVVLSDFCSNSVAEISLVSGSG
jgi:hypothetical protein